MTIKLIKLRLLSVFGQMTRGNAEKDGGKKKNLVLMIAVYALIAAIFASVFTFMAIGLAPTLIALCADWFYFLLFIGIDVSLVFIFGIFATKSEIFECRDNELLLSMPIKPASIVLSRTFSVIIWNYIESAVVFVPAIIVYAVFGGMSKGIVGGILLFLFIPLLPTALSCLVGYIVSALSAKFKRKTFITVLFFLVFFGAYMFGYSSLVEGVDELIANAGSAADSVERFVFLRAIGEAALLAPLPLIIIAAASVLSAAAAVFAISLGFEKIVFSHRGEKKKTYKKKRMEKSSSLVSLTKKELSRFFSSSTYIINSSLGLIFMILISGYAMLKKDELFFLAENFGAFFEIDPAELVSVALIAALAVMASFSYISSCALSLEGKSLWIMKSMPVTAREVLLSKTLFHLVITAPPTLIASVLLLIATGEYASFWYYISVPQMLGAAGALIGTLWNTAFPKFDFTNEASVIKNSASVSLTILSVMLIGAAMAVMGIWLLIRIPFIAVALIELAVLALLIAALLFILEKYATVKYESL